MKRYLKPKHINNIKIHSYYSKINMFNDSHGFFRNRFDVADSRVIIPERTKDKFNLLNEFKQDGHHY